MTIKGLSCPVPSHMGWIRVSSIVFPTDTDMQLTQTETSCVPKKSACFREGQVDCKHRSEPGVNVLEKEIWYLVAGNLLELMTLSMCAVGAGILDVGTRKAAATGPAMDTQAAHYVPEMFGLPNVTNVRVLMVLL